MVMAIEDELILRNMQEYFRKQREQQEIMNARDARVADAMARQGAMVQRNRQMAVDPNVIPFASPAVTTPSAMNVGPHMFANVGPIEEAYEPENKAEAATTLGIDYGGFKAQQNNKNQGLLSPEGSTGDSSFSIENLLGGVKDVFNDPFIATLFQIAAQPEAFTDPRGLGAGVATAGQKVFEAQAEQQKAEAARQLEYDKLRVQMAKSGKRPEFKQFMAKMVTDARQQKQGLETVQKIKRLLGKEGAGGIAGAFESFVSDAGAIFGASGGQSVNQQIQKYNAYLLSSLGSGIASGQISQEDYKRIDAMLKNPDIFTDADKLLDAYNDVERIIGNAYKANSDILREVGYGNLIEPSVARDRGIQVPD
jgi:hypothetical protein